jgi:hypothetical protein
MRRRAFISLLGGATTWPLMAVAQQPGTPLIGFLRSSTLADATNLMTAFRQGLEETGYIEGQNVATEYRFAENDRDKLTALVKDFYSSAGCGVRRKSCRGARSQGRKHDSADCFRDRHRPGQRRLGD